jgi:hypothetical protein
LNLSLRFTEMLTGGDRRSAGAADQVAAMAAEPGAFADLWPLLSHPDPVVRMRAADAAEKASRARPELVAQFADDLMTGRLEDGSPELTWHLLPMAARLPLQPEQTGRLMRRCEEAVLNHPSHIVQAEALSAAFRLAADDRRMLARVRNLAREAAKSPSQALAARARALLGGD